MSLLLDAIKKSEQERKQGEDKTSGVADRDASSAGIDAPADSNNALVGSKGTLFESFSGLSNLKKVFYLGGPACLVLVVGIFMYEPQIEIEESFAPPISEEAFEPLLTQKMEADLQAKMADVFAATPDMLEHVQKQGVPTELNSETIKSKGASDFSGAETIGSNSSSSNEKEPGAASSAPQAVNAVSIYQLPLNLRSKVPDLRFEGFLYSSDAEYRSVTINGRKLQEGDWLNPKLKLLQITEQNVIYAVEGVQFSVPVMTDYVAE